MDILNSQTIKQATEKYGTPIHFYSEQGLRNSCRSLNDAFDWSPHYKNFYAVKANSNPHILEIIRQEGHNVDCSSLTELEIADAVGFRKDQIIFTSNETPLHEYKRAIDLGAIVNIDDLSHLCFIKDRIGCLPEFVSFRFNPGVERSSVNSIIGDPVHSKFGMTRSQIFKAYSTAIKIGSVKRFGLHCMLVSNCQRAEEIEETARMIFTLAREVFDETGAAVELINIGGGFGIDYLRDGSPSFDVVRAGLLVRAEFASVLEKSELKYHLDKKGIELRIATECGRFIAGPNGCLLTRVLHQKNTFKNYIGVDATMANLMRPAMYNSYHHILRIKVNDQELKEDNLEELLPSRNRDILNSNHFPPEAPPRPDPKGPQACFDVVGSLCENNDKFAVDRSFYAQGVPKVGDLLAICDTGAHGYCMGFQYNGKLRSAEVLLTTDGRFELIRRAETLADYLSTVLELRPQFGSNIISSKNLKESKQPHKKEIPPSELNIPISNRSESSKCPPELTREKSQDSSCVIRDDRGRVVKEAVVSEGRGYERPRAMNPGKIDVEDITETK